MKKITLGCIFLVTLFLFGCPADENDLLFAGEGENWSSKVTVNQTDGEETYHIQINYKGLSSPEIEGFSYYIETKNTGVFDFKENNASLNDEGIFQKVLPISNSASTSGKDELVIKIEWNGFSEEFILKTNESY